MSAFDDEAAAGLGPHVSPFAASTMRPLKATRQGPMALHKMTSRKMAGWLVALSLKGPTAEL